MDKPKNLMYVKSVSMEGPLAVFDLRGVGNSTGVTLRMCLPKDIANKMQGRHVFVNGSWGDVCEFHSWPEIPTV